MRGTDADAAAGPGLARRDLVRVGGALGAAVWAAPRLATVRLGQVPVGSPGVPTTGPGNPTTTIPQDTTTTTPTETTTTTTPTGETTTTTAPAETTTTTAPAETTTTTAPGPPNPGAVGTTTTTPRAPVKDLVGRGPSNSPTSAPVVPTTGATTPPASTAGRPGTPSGGPGRRSDPPDDQPAAPGSGLLPFTGSDARTLTLTGVVAVAFGRLLMAARGKRTPAVDPALPASAATSADPTGTTAPRPTDGTPPTA